MPSTTIPASIPVYRPLAMTIAVALLAACSPPPANESTTEPATAATDNAQGAAPATPSNHVSIVGARIFDATGRAPYVGTVVIKDGRIVAVGPDVATAADSTVIDAAGKALLPGFFDLHTHWAGHQVADISNAYLAAGVTTVNDFSAEPEAYELRRKWLGSIASPHVNLAGRVSTPLGHGAPAAGADTYQRWAYSPDSARIAIQELAAYKSDNIKAFTDGWRYRVAADDTSFTVEGLSALVDEAHKHGLPVLSHTVSVHGARIAADAGIDVIAHAIQDAPFDADTLAALKQAGTYYAPTLANYEPNRPEHILKRPEKLEPGFFTQIVWPDPNDALGAQTIARFQLALDNVKRAHEAGIKLTTGTDAGLATNPHGRITLREIELLVKAGLTPTESLIAATANSAEALDVLADRGTIEAGKRADLVLIDGAPWEQVEDVYNVHQVLVDGNLVHGPGAQRPAQNEQAFPPALTVQTRIDDFEHEGDRSLLGTRRYGSANGGHEPSFQVIQRVPRTDGGHALLVSSRLSNAGEAYSGVVIPLSKGAAWPVDASAHTGIRFDIRGSAGTRDIGIDGFGGTRWRGEVAATESWKRHDIAFSSLKPGSGGRPASAGNNADTSQPQWTGRDLSKLSFSTRGKPDEHIWFEIDNVEFY